MSQHILVLFIDSVKLGVNETKNVKKVSKKCQ